MDLTTLITHFANFAAPAVVLALCLPLAGRFLASNNPVPLIWWSQIAINFISCLAILLLGLWFFGRDGKMATYAAMVLAGGTGQWVMGLALWRRKA
jgi:hypothetical protein